MTSSGNAGNRPFYENSTHNQFVNSVIHGDVSFSSRAETDESKCLRSLYTSDYGSHKRRNPKRADGTLEWFLEHEKYRHWQEEKSGLLWVTADPGCGKSVLAAFLVDELRHQSSHRQSQTSIQTPEVVEPRDTVCFFFFKDDNEVQKTATFALSALLHQLFSEKRFLLRHAMKDYKDKGEIFAQEFGTLWRIFKAATADPACGNVICIFDALDECEESTRTDLIASLVSMYAPTADTDQMFPKFLLTSRSYGWIERPFSRLPSIRLKAEEQTPAISADIERVINSEVEALGNARGLTVRDRINLRDKLIQGADRTFLWVSLIFKILNGSQAASRKKFLDTLNTLPSGLDTVYEKILGDSCDREEAKRILQIVVAATRPLTLDEMDIALAIQPDHNSIEDLEPYRLYSVETTVKEICGLFVRVVDSKIYLIHQTAKEFLMKGRTTGQPAVDHSAYMWKQSLCLVESNLTLAKSCIYYLLFTDFEARPLTPRVGEQEIDQFAKEHVFLDYAAKNWAAHVLEAAMWEDEELSTTALQVFKSGPGRLLTWFLVYQKANASRGYFDSTDINSLAAASFMGHEAAVKLLIEKGEDVNGCRSLYGNALNVAALRKNRDVAKLLLNNGAIVCLYGREFRNLLQTSRKDFRNWFRAAFMERARAAREEMERMMDRMMDDRLAAMMKRLLDRAADREDRLTTAAAAAAMAASLWALWWMEEEELEEEMASMDADDEEALDADMEMSYADYDEEEADAASMMAELFMSEMDEMWIAKFLQEFCVEDD